MFFYDLYVSIGPICRPAYHLKMNGLRIGAYPLDWQFAYSLDTVIHLFKTGFRDFFVNIEEVDIEQEGKHRRVKDITNNIISIHHFPKDQSLEEAHEEFLQKMRRRFIKLDETLKNAQKIVLISERGDTLETLKKFLTEFSSLYPHLEIKLVNVRNNKTMNADVYTKKEYPVNHHLSIEEYSFNDNIKSSTQEKADWRGNEKIWREILKDYYSNYYYEIMQRTKAVSEHLVIYGAGKRCTALLKKFKRYNVKIKGIAVTDTSNNPDAVESYTVDVIDKYDKDDFIVVSIADRQEAEIIKNSLLSKGYHNISLLNKYLVIENFIDTE